ncbi:hypothetical protein DASC09_048030 [Saccharomycopsis crataegensis]|uniref:RRM domain-containing protein n=1 Tax=Saccharomycopsis crataegensis TaxID=43959 RepID=A0AAV5QRQ1_9ASCO|nr:hypothetical protein DASC09_048030 [Saccharomycopsis crataegensis]
MSKPQKSGFPIMLLKNLPFEATPTDLFTLCSKFGTVLQIRKGVENHLKGNCFVVFDDLAKTKQAIEHLNGFNFKGRYLVALHYSVDNRALEEAAAKVRSSKNGESGGTENERLVNNLMDEVFN